MSQLIDILAEDNDLIPYRKSLRQLTGSVTSAILLQQIIHRAKCKHWEPFYKFKSSCGHKLYQDGDSWTEELGFSIKEFDTAIGKIGTKATRDRDKLALMNGDKVQNIVTYWTDSSRVTWYYINKGLLAKLLKGIYQLNAESAFSKITKGHLPITESPQRVPEITVPQKSPEKKDKPKQYTHYQLIFGHLAKLYNIDLDLMTRKQKNQLRQESEKLIKAGKNPSQIGDFAAWWYVNDWRGKKNQRPIPYQVSENWGQFESDTNGIPKKEREKMLDPITGEWTGGYYS